MLWKSLTTNWVVHIIIENLRITWSKVWLMLNAHSKTAMFFENNFCFVAICATHPLFILNILMFFVKIKWAFSIYLHRLSGIVYPRGDSMIFLTWIFMKIAIMCSRGLTVYQKNKNNFVGGFKMGGDRQKWRKFSLLDRLLKAVESILQFWLTVKLLFFLWTKYVT